jgi:hypothetical protein
MAASSPEIIEPSRQHPPKVHVVSEVRARAFLEVNRPFAFIP